MTQPQAPDTLSQIPKSYSPQAAEDRWYETWSGEGFFAARDASDRPAFSIVIPPPNVTGSLHMGHALNATLQDVLVRWKRMAGFNALWLPGTDHAGIATQNVVEKQLAGEGTDRHRIGRAEFTTRVWKWKETSGGRIIRQLKRLGASCDWPRERFTMDEGLSRAVREVFVRLFEEGLVYRGSYIVNWCPRCHTALSDLEVEHEERKGKIYFVRYPAADGGPGVEVATTRPETMLGDAAVAVHPDDDRYKGKIGLVVSLPLTGRKIPVIADPAVSPEFGTGAVKVTPAHDPADFEIGRRHDLPEITVIGDDGRMTAEAGEAFAGLDRAECREKVAAALSAEGLLAAVQDHIHSVGHCYRCKTVVEPLVKDQWFVRVAPLAEPAIEAVESGRIRIVPRNWEKTYFEWMRNIRDWCISRQIWWGHRIPAWYCGDCHGGKIRLKGRWVEEPSGMAPATQPPSHPAAYAQLRAQGLSHERILAGMDTLIADRDVPAIVSREDNPACPSCGGKNVIQDPDVLDTWFSSALWPFSTLGWPDKTPALETFYPTSILVTGFDILFFWVARMIMMGLKFMGDVPFRDVYIHALVRDAEGRKMSKSKGNVIDPLDIVDKHGADAFRFTLAAMAAQGRDVKLSEERIEGYRNFANKIWNASRFVLMNVPPDLSTRNVSRETPWAGALADRWIASRLSAVAAEVNQALTDYRFNEAAAALYQFIWHEYCDWYIELAKISLFGEDAAAKQRTQTVLVMVLETTLRLLHPFMPFLTEEIWQALPPDCRTQAPRGGTIMLAPFPAPDGSLNDRPAEAAMSKLMEAIGALRMLRSEMSVPPSLEVAAVFSTRNKGVAALLDEHAGEIARLARCRPEIGVGLARPSKSAVQILPEMEVYLPLEGVVRIEDEIARLEKEIEKADKEVFGLAKKFENPDFVSKAPPEVVENGRARLAELAEKRRKIGEQAARLSEIGRESS
ncbi:MAG: valine--tRNA ligase [Nitrospirae bacterium]|nr:valine--tRNA ligase [Nitrospirota bacterium]